MTKRFLRPGDAARAVGAAIALAALLILDGCGGDKIPAGREDLPLLGEAQPTGWVGGSLSAVHASVDMLPWLGSAVTSAERPKDGLVEPYGVADPAEVSEQEQRHGAAPSVARAVEPRVALRFPASMPASRLMGQLSGVAHTVAMGDVWIACRNASNEPGWVRLPILYRAEESTLSWEAVPPGEESEGVRLELLPSSGALGRLRERYRKIPEEEVWKRLARLVAIGDGTGRILRVLTDPTVTLEQLLVTLRRLETVSDASLVVSVADSPLR